MSIVAVFLALALGIVTGSTLLDRVTVQQLESTQSQIERKIQQKSTENDALRRALDTSDVQAQAFSRSILPGLLAGRARGASYVVLAMRGIDENAVRDVLGDLRAGGATGYGTLWLDQRLDLSRPEAVAALARLYGRDDIGGDSQAAELRQRFVDDLAGDLAASTDDRPDDVVSGGFVARLATNGLVDWDASGDAGVAARTLPSDGATVVVLGGEGALVSAEATLLPVTSALVRDAPGHVVAGEVMNRRSSADAAVRSTDERQPRRGAFVSRLRKEEDLVSSCVTVDDVDLTGGRLALALAVAQRLPNGRFGILPDAEAPFPPLQP